MYVVHAYVCPSGCEAKRPRSPNEGEVAEAMSTRRQIRQANLLGAFALAVVDRLHEELTAAGERGLSATAALIHLRLRPGRNIDFLARLLRISHPATVRIVDRLEDDGLIERRPGLAPRERALVLTKAG